MKKYLLLFMLSFCTAFGQYYPPVALSAQNPSGQFVTVGLDGNGHLYTNPIGSAIQASTLSGYVPPAAMTAQGPTGSPVYLKADANGNLYVNSSGGLALPATTANNTTNDTTAAQTAEPTGGTEGNPFLSGTYVTNAISQYSVFKPGLTFTNALTYTGFNRFEGTGDATSFEFCGTSAAQNWMSPNTSSYTWSTTQDNVNFSNFRVDSQSGCANTPASAFYINSANRVVIDNVKIGSGFTTGLWLDQTTGGASYYNSYRDVNIFHATAQSEFINYEINAINHFGGDFRDGPSDAYKTSGYNVVEAYNGSTTAPLSPQVINYFGTALEGNLLSTGAQIKIEGPTGIWGVYNEDPKGVDGSNNPNGLSPTADIDFSPYTRATGYSVVKGDMGHILEFHNYAAPQIGTILSGSMIFAPEVDQGNPKFIDICDNCNLHNGQWNFAATAGGGNGTIATEANALGLDGASAQLVTFTGTSFGASYGVGWTIPTAQLTPFVGQWIYLNVWVQDGTSTPVALENLIVTYYGAGVTQANAMKQWRTKLDNGMYLYVVPINVISSATLSIDIGFVFNAATSTSFHILGAEFTKDGWEVLPTYRPNTHRCSNAAPSSGTWFAGDVCQNIAPTASGSAALYLNYTAGSPGSWSTH